MTHDLMTLMTHFAKKYEHPAPICRFWVLVFCILKVCVFCSSYLTKTFFLVPSLMRMMFTPFCKVWEGQLYSTESRDSTSLPHVTLRKYPFRVCNFVCLTNKKSTSNGGVGRAFLFCLFRFLPFFPSCIRKRYETDF